MKKVKLAVVIASISSDISNILSYIDFSLKNQIEDAAQSVSNDALFEALNNDLSDFDRDVRANISSSDLDEIQYAISEGDLDSAYEEIKALCIVDKDSSLSTIIGESQQRAYEDITFSNFKTFLEVFQEALAEAVIEDDNSDRDGELPENFDYWKVIEKILEKPEFIDTDSFELED